MANIVIVTKQCYLLAQAITYIAIDKVQDDQDKERLTFVKPRRYKKKPTKRQIELAQLKEMGQLYNININFIPVNNGINISGSGRGNGETCELCITVGGREATLALFSDMVSQIREQLPDQLFLDTLVERFLTSHHEGDKK